MLHQKGYVGMIIVFLLALVVLIIWPLDFGQSNKKSCLSFDPNAPSQINGPGVRDVINDINSPSNRTFKLIRTNVPIRKIEHFLKHVLGTPPAAALIPGYQVNYLNSKADVNGLFLADYSLVFLYHLEGGVPKTITLPGIGGKTGPEYLIVNIYQDVAPATKPLPEEIFDCKKGNDTEDVTSAGPTLTFIYPSQSPAPSPSNKQLQLEYFVLDSQNPGWTIGCKPAIYLYPNHEMQVNVKVKTRGFLTYTNPKYPDGGWDVEAFPDGTIYDHNSYHVSRITYPYLYYESKVPDQLINIPKTGFTIPFDQLDQFYSLLLPALGLNPTQTQDFKTYWEKALPYSPYYFVGVMSQDDINSIEPLEITPKPDNINRVRLYFKALEKKPSQTIEEPNLPSLPSDIRSPKSDFRVLEWGGMVKNDPASKFTCSE